MSRDIVFWIVLSSISMYSLYTFSTTIFLSAFVFVLLYTLSLLGIKKYNKSVAKHFFIFLAIVFVGVSLYHLAENDLVLTAFFLGKLVAIIFLALPKLEALPFIEGRTREKAGIHLGGYGFHHWFWGSLIMLGFVFFLPYVEYCPFFSWILEPERVAFFLGFGLFCFASQIPEILLSKAAFSIRFKADC